ncbi:MAG: hypothetical protein ABRQ38_17240 [Candidatus Eremiobacterota bacterium]
MKTIFMCLFLLLIISAGCSAGDTVTQSEHMAGGYSEIPVTEQIVSDTVAYLHDCFITDETYKGLVITEVEKAFSQVVAGRNIKLICRGQKGRKNQKWEFIVFIDLKNNFNFTEGTLIEDNISIPGGYVEISIDEKDVTDTVKFLNEYFSITEEYKNMNIEKINHAYSQVVAGRNITIDCTVKNGEETEEWGFTVFIDLQNKFNFTEGKKI